MKKYFLLLLLLLLPVSVISLSAQDAQFRGKDRDGIYPDTGLLDHWPEGGPDLIATISGIGDGFGSPSVTDQGIYVAGMIDSTGYLFCYNHQYELVWKRSYGKEFTYKYTGSRGTPTLEKNRLYYSGTYGNAVCLNAGTGEAIWRKDIFKEYGGKPVKWGYTESPLLYGNRVILTPGGPGANIVALDKHDGHLIWASSIDSTINAYCSPILVDHRGKKWILMNTRDYLLMLEPETGKVGFSHPIYHPQTNHATAPLYYDGKVFYSSGYGEGSVLFRIDNTAGQLDTIYVNRDLDCKLSGLIRYHGTVFGTSDKKKQWVGVDLATGKTLFTSRNLKPGSFLLADDLFIIFTETGEVALVPAGKDNFTITSRFSIPVQPANLAFAHPVLFRGILYIRYRDHLWMYRLTDGTGE